MKAIVLVAVMLLAACESKKSSGTTTRMKSALRTESVLQVSEKGQLKALDLQCEYPAQKFEEAPANGQVIGLQELSTGEAGVLALASVRSLVLDESGFVKLIEFRENGEYVQSCKELGGIGDFQLRYAAPRFISLKDGSFGKSNGSKSLASRYRVLFENTTKGTNVQAFLGEVKLKGKIHQDLVDQLPEFANAEIRAFRLDNGGLEIRAKKAGPHSSEASLVWIMTYQKRAR